MADFADVRLHVVTGKGGTGKTTVAAALALALATGGRRVLLLEVEGRQGIAQLFDTPPLPYEERKVAVAPGGGDVYALAVDPEQALLDYLQMFYRLSPTGIPARTLRRMGAFDFATTIAPGLRDVLLTGKMKEVVVRTEGGGRRGKQDAPADYVYDAVVLDAPPTGRIVRFLNISHEVGGLAKVGPIKTQSEGVMAVLRSPQTAVHLVTLLEEMPVQETIDGVAELEAVGLPVGGVIVNGVRTPALPPAELAAARAGRLDSERLASALGKAGLDVPPPVVTALLAEVGEHAERVELEESGRDALAHLSRPTYELPRMVDAVALDSLYEMAETLCQQGMV